MIEGRDPTGGIFEEPGVAVCINQAYIPFILGALEVLTQPDYWETLFPVDQIQQLIGVLAGDNSEDCSPVIPTDFTCDFPFATGTHGWAAYSGYATYIGSLGWKSITVSSSCELGEAFSLLLQADFGASVIVTKVIVDYEVATGSVNRAMALFTYNFATRFTSVSDPGTGRHTFVWEGSQSLTGLSIDIDGCGPGPAVIYDVLVITEGHSVC